MRSSPKLKLAPTRPAEAAVASLSSNSCFLHTSPFPALQVPADPIDRRRDRSIRHPGTTPTAVAMEEELELAHAKDAKERMAGIEHLHQLLEAPRKTLSPTTHRRRALASAAMLSGKHSKLHFNALVPTVVERLGDAKQPFRDAAKRLLLTLMVVELSKGQDLTIGCTEAGEFEKSLLVQSRQAIGLFASTELPLQQMLNDPNPGREQATAATDVVLVAGKVPFTGGLELEQIKVKIDKDKTCTMCSHKDPNGRKSGIANQKKKQKIKERNSKKRGERETVDSEAWFGD
ncbi:hypothetical protein C2S52_001329 [Perilla frutescens var. hirtella]|nr:hypothetical protein C2S52_001329 [Perilla frutescens var. hirtella]